MSDIKFKTSIMCNACVNAVTSSLDELVGKDNWTVDLSSKDRVLTVKTNDSQKVIDTLKKVGYQASTI